mmetsp:Transcript_51668/g.118703  ORF Transcript_51668/g.118703 Transcript_51668/m.118703 type:complete len:249 (-) Transcript_51668:265-1011(-)
MEDVSHLPRLRDQISGFRLLDLDSTEDCRNRHRRSALNVVVVGEEFLAVLGEKRECVVRIEILELKQAALAKELSGSSHKLQDETVLSVVARIHQSASLRLVLCAVLLETQILWVVADGEAGRIARRIRAANVEHQRDRLLRVETAADSVEVELARWDAHARDAKIAKAKNAAAIGEDDALAIVRAIFVLRQHDLCVLLQRSLEIAAVRKGEVHAARVLRKKVELLARLADRRRVSNRQQERRFGSKG